MTLGTAGRGTVCRVMRIELPTKVRRRLGILGMTDGCAVTIMNTGKNGAVIIKVRGVRLALGRKFAEKIFVGGADR